MTRENNKCKIEISEKGLEIDGECALGLPEVLASTYSVSKKSKAEIFACACLNPETAEVEKVVIGNIGTPTSVSTNGVERVCPKDTRQISYHTHPVSEEAKFSAADGSVIVDRFNKEYDDGHCVVGSDEYRCILHTFQKGLEKASEV
jgi:hypothetical protein